MSKSPPVAKLSVSVPAALAARVRERVGSRGLSAFAARALRRELEREQLSVLLDELEGELGAPDEGLVSEVDSLWPDS